MGIRHFMDELRRRKVFRVAAVYTVVGWLVAQVIDVVNDPLNLPDWFGTVVIVLLIAGFPMALVLAWAFDITPGGVVRGVAGDTETTKQVAAVETAARPVLENSVAVLPFENMSPDPDKAYFAAGVHEEVLAQLTMIKALNVIARTSVLQFASGRAAIPDIARELNVWAVMEGSVRYDGNRVRINAQLVAADSNTRLWSESYDRELVDIFEIQTDIAKRIAQALTVELSLGEEESLEQRSTGSADAYDPFLKAMALYREGDSAVGVTAAPGKRHGIHDYLDKALSLDPGFALAHAWKAWLYSYSRAYDPVAENEWLSRSAELDALVRHHADLALAGNPGLGLAKAAHAKVHLYNWSIGRAAESIEAAHETSPNDSEVLRWCANIKWFGEQHQEANALAEQAVQLDPRNAFYYDVLGRTFQSAGKYRDAVAAFRKSIEIEPETPVNYISVARPELSLGNDRAALAALETAATLLGRDASPAVYADLANGYARLGDGDAATRAVETMTKLASERYVDPAVWAFSLMAVGKYEQARERLTRLVEEPALLSSPFTLMFIRENVWSDPVLDRAEFAKLRESLAFKG